MLEAVDRLIAAVANRQHGVITRWQLLDLGVSPNAIDYRIRIGRLHRLYDRVYAVGHRPVSSHAHAIAAVLACGAGAALSHSSAATLWGITKHWQQPLEVTAPTKHDHRRLRTHRAKTLARRDITKHWGIPVTTPCRTLLDSASRLTDPALARAVNDLRLARYLNLADLGELLARHPPTKATKRLRRQLAHPERSPTRSEFEAAFPAFAERAGLPQYKINADVAGHEVDVYFPAQRLAIELDGLEYHDGRYRFESDRDRDADLLAVGIPTVRITRERLSLKPAREAARLHAILAQRPSCAPES